MSAAITASTESGRAAVVPVARAMSSNSKRKSTLPPERRAISSTTWGGSGCSSVAISTISADCRSVSGRRVNARQRRSSSPTGAQVVARSECVTTRTYRSEAAARDRRTSRSALASSMNWTSSTANIVGGAAEGVEEKAERDVCQRVAQEALVQAARLGRRRQVEPEQNAEQGHPRHELRVDPGDHLAQTTLGGIRIRTRFELQRRPHRGTQGEIRSRCFVLLAPRAEDT